MVGYDGVTRVIWERGRPWRAPDGRLMIDGFALDMTEQKRAEHELQVVLERLEVERAVADRRARIDSLTGVYNRSHLAEVIEIELERAVREGTTPGVFLIDLDHFKRVNDTYGHLPGDAVLVQAAARIRRSVRPYDCVARWGGEEFAVDRAGGLLGRRAALDRRGPAPRHRRRAVRGRRRAAVADRVRRLRPRRPRPLDRRRARGGRRPGAVRGQGRRPQPHPHRPRRAVGLAGDGRCRHRDDRPGAGAGGGDPRRPAHRPRPPGRGAGRPGGLRAGPRPARLRPRQRRRAAGRRRADSDRRRRAHVADGRPGRRSPTTRWRSRTSCAASPGCRTWPRCCGTSTSATTAPACRTPWRAATSRSRRASWPRP